MLRIRYVISYSCTIGCRIVNWVTADGCVHIAESVGSRRELVAIHVHTADADATQLDSFVASASAVSIGHCDALNSSRLRYIVLQWTPQTT